MFRSNWTIAFLVMILGLSCGWFLFLVFGNCAMKCQIAYVSQREILTLEKERIVGSKESSLFGGRTDQTIALIRRESLKLQNKNTKVIFVDDFVLGDGVYSVSKKVHSEVIKILKQE